MSRRFLLALYAHFLRLYPHAFHCECAPEMRAVFGALLDDTVVAGLPALLRLPAREIAAAPRSLLAAPIAIVQPITRLHLHLAPHSLSRSGL